MSPAGADRNLLYGILALQMDFVSRDQLVEAMHAWVLTQATPLGRILCQRGVLPQRRAAVLDALVEEHLACHDDDPQRSLAAVRLDPVVCRDLEQLDDAEMHHCLTSLAAGGTTATLVPPPPSPGPALRYRRLCEHARGGLGTVFVAVDEELQRQVALKEIQERFADQPDCRGRFVREAAVTGNLEHPGVVPVYGLGCYADGRPYYAMRFIKGESLHEAIGRFHQADEGRRDPGERELSLRGLLGRFVDVCNALAYAHSRSVIHRDVKPANVMLGEFGETLVVDWGLARVLRQPEGDATTAAVPLPLASDGDSAATVPGQTVGTPAFMAPEQAQGEHERVGVATDVFALGATLYALLTGQPPYRGKLDEVLAKARRAEVAPARQVNPRVPAALEAVCNKALAARLEDRYTSARELAGEVERWLADEPVLAHREGLGTRLRRWGRRHRTAVTAALVLLVASVVGLGLGLWAVQREKAQTARERDLAVQAEKKAMDNQFAAENAEHRARQELKRADQNLELARQAVDECFGLAKADPLLQEEGLVAVRKLLLAKTLPFYRAFSKQKPTDRRLASQQADYLFRTSYITAEIGRQEEALASYRQARDVLLDLSKKHPQVADYQEFLAHTWNNLGFVYREMGRSKEALTCRERALQLDLALRKAHPKTVRYRANLASTLHHLGGLQREMGRRNEALASYQQARALRQALAEAHPEVADCRNDLANTLDDLGGLQRETGQPKEALQCYQTALGLRLVLRKSSPRAPRYQFDLAVTWTKQGNLQHETGLTREALQSYQNAVDLMRELSTAYPLVTRYQGELAGACYNLGTLLGEMGKPDEALANHEKARDLRLALTRAHPDIPEYRGDLARSLNKLGNLQRDAGKPPEALKSYQQARDLLQALSNADPQLARHRDDLAATWNNLGHLHRRMGKGREAEGCYVRARDLWGPLAQAYPEVVRYQVFLARTWTSLGQVQSDSGRLNEALKNYERARDRQLALTGAHPEVVEYRADLGTTWNNLGLLQRDMGQPSAALQSYTRARDIDLALVKAQPEVVSHRMSLAATSCNLGNLLRDTGKARQSLELFARAIELFQAVRQHQPNHPIALRFLRNSHWGRAQALDLLGRPRDAAADWDQAERLTTGTTRYTLRLFRAGGLARAGEHTQATRYAEALARLTNLSGEFAHALAVVYALSARAAASAAARPLPEREKQAEGYAQQALALLERARQDGFFRTSQALQQLKKETDLDFLRQRDDFRRFLSRVEGDKR
jgi:serine/threonine-protein kinase